MEYAKNVEKFVITLLWAVNFELCRKSTHKLKSNIWLKHEFPFLTKKRG